MGHQQRINRDVINLNRPLPGPQHFESEAQKRAWAATLHHFTEVTNAMNSVDRRSLDHCQKLANKGDAVALGILAEFMAQRMKGN